MTDKRKAKKPVPIPPQSIKNKELISHFAEFDETFIDDLNGSDFKIDEITKMTNQELFNIPEWNLKEEFDHNLFGAISTILYNFLGKVEEDYNYVDKLIQGIKSNKEIQDNIIKCIQNSSAKATPLIIEILTKAENLFRTCTSFAEIFKEYRTIMFKRALRDVLVNSERDNVLFIYMNLDPEYLPIFQPKWKFYLDNLDLTKHNFSDEIGKNNVNHIIGLNLPFITSEVEEIKVYIKPILEDYFEKEDDCRYLKLKQSFEGATIDNKIGKYKSYLSGIINNITTEIKKHNNLNDIFNNIEEYSKDIKKKEIAKKLTHDLYNDLFRTFISEKLKDKRADNLNKLIKQVIDLKFPNKSTNEMENYAAALIFLYGNDKYLYQLCDLYYFLEKYIKFPKQGEENKQLVDNIIDNISLGMISLNPNDNYNKAQIEVNKPFYIVHEAILQEIFIDKELFNFSDEQKSLISYDYIRDLKNVENLSSQINLSLNLKSKENFIIKNFNTAYEILSKTGDKITENIRTYINFLLEERRVDKEDDLVKNMIEEHDFLKKNVNQKYVDSSKFEINQFITIIKQHPQSMKLKEAILDILLNDENIHLLVNSKKLFREIFASNDQNMSITPYFVRQDSNDDFDSNEKCLAQFMSFFRQEDSSIMRKLEEKKENKVLNEVLLSLFETNIICFFKDMKENLDNNFCILTEELPVDYFKKCVTYYCSHKKEPYSINNNSVGKIYSIAYIKCFCNEYVNLNYKQYKNDEIPFNQITTILNEESSSLVHMIKIYILKLFKEKLNNYEDLKTFNWSEHKIDWTDEFRFTEEAKSAIDFAFFDIENFNKYQQQINFFGNLMSSNFKMEDGNLQQKISMDSLSPFFDVLLNKLIANSFFPEFLQGPDYKNFSTFVSNKIKNLQTITKEAKTFFEIFTRDEMITKFFPKIQGKKNKGELFKVLLVSAKLCLIGIACPQKNFYSKLFSTENEKEWNNSYIPGGEPNDDRLIGTYEAAEQYLKETNNPSEALYICSCNSYYTIKPCGLPNGTSNCSTCHEPIGGEKHKLIDRPGHYRLYYTEEHRKQVEGRSYYKPLRFKMIWDLKKEVDDLRKIETKGFKKDVDYYFFMQKEKKVRELDQVTYRFLSFSVYSTLYFAILAGFITENQFKDNYSFRKKPCLDIIYENWKLLKKQLSMEKIGNIHIFMHLAIPKFASLMTECCSLDTPEKRRNFERKAVLLIADVKSQYSEMEKLYTQKNNEVLNLKAGGIRVVINEMNSPDELDKDIYPDLEYFILTSYPDEEELLNEIEAMENKSSLFPTTLSYFKNRDDIKQMENFLKMNKFQNFMIDRYSYKIARGDAKELIMENELNEIGDVAQMDCDDFILGFNDEMKYLEERKIEVKYRCRGELDYKEIKVGDKLANFLNDVGELNYGMYIAGIFQKFIEAQNKFLTAITENISQSAPLYFFKEEIEKPILLQDASNIEIVSPEINLFNSNYNGFFELISNYSSRNCFDKEGKINYSEYKNLTYDINGIEEELGGILLPGKHLLKDEQRFVTFAFEGYFGGKSVVLTEFQNKYKKTFKKEEMAKVTEKKVEMGSYLKKLNSVDKFLLSAQLMIFYLLKENQSPDTPMQKVINKLPNYVVLDDCFKNFYLTHTTYEIWTLIDFNDFAEYLSLKKILENMNPDFNYDLEPQQIKKINDYFNIPNDNRLITKVVLSKAVRRLFSRYYSGKRTDIEVKLDDNLIFYIQYKEEIWDPEILAKENEERFDDELTNMSMFGIRINQIIQFYNELGGDGVSYSEFGAVDIAIQKRENNEEEIKANEAPQEATNNEEEINTNNNEEKIEVAKKPKRIIKKRD